MPLVELDAEDKALLEQHVNRQQILVQEQAKLLERLSKVSEKLAIVQGQYGYIHNSRISKISRLPNHILSIIFEILHRSQPLVSSTSSTKDSYSEVGGGKRRETMKRRYASSHSGTLSCTRRAEVVLSQVCSKWRAIALDSMPSLWSVFWCDKPITCTHILHETSRLRTYLTRSGTQDLELHLDFTWTEPEPESIESMTRFRALASEMLSLAAQYTERWKYFTLLANDASGRVSLIPLRKELACKRAPRLERMVVCAWASKSWWKLEEEGGWEAQILLFLTGQGSDSNSSSATETGPCPRLRYLKLDNAGLAFCRPPIQNVTHLTLDPGVSAVKSGELPLNHSFRIEWPVLVSSDVLRLPHLETLSLSDNIIDRSTFPMIIDDDEDSGGKYYHLDFPTIKHLRISGCPFLRGHQRSFLWYLIRCVTAPKLESLTLSTFKLSGCPWKIDPGEWLASGSDGAKVKLIPHEVFPSLDTLTLIDMSVSTDPKPCAAFLRLAWMTAGAKNLVIVSPSSKQSGPSGSTSNNSDNDENLDITAILEQRAPWTLNQIPLDALWPDAIDISLTLPSDPRLTYQDALEAYMGWPGYLAKKWKDLEVVRIPPFWLDSWLGKLERPGTVDWDLPNYSWTENMKGGSRGVSEFEEEQEGEGYEREEQEKEETEVSTAASLSALPSNEASVSSTTTPRKRPIRIEPISEDIPLWPPGSGTNRFNTLESSRCFDPLHNCSTTY